MRSLLILGTALALGATSPLSGQATGSVDIGAYFRATQADELLSSDQALGYGGRFGLFIKRNLALEFDLSRNETTKQNYLLMQPFSARLAWHAPLSDNWAGIIGAGWVREWTDPTGPGGPWADDGATALVGLQRKLSGRTALRVDLVGEFFSTPINYRAGTNEIENTNLALQIGLNWHFREQVAPAPAPMMPAPAPAPPADTDRDGVIDANDACANTPAGTRVDASGCAVPLDSDRDGVMDNMDRCANTPAGTRVDANGCAIPVDTDRDGVMDNVDRCADTPAGTRVDVNGCPLPVDTDGDGVMDNVDVCPNTARGTVVDGRGCARVFEEGRTSIVLEGVTFATNSAVLTAPARVVLDRMANQLNGAPDINVEVQGHTDNTGSAATNTRLSGLRAESVRAYLVAKGVSNSRLTAKGYGPSQPVADNGTPAGRQQNRRVELKRTN